MDKTKLAALTGAIALALGMIVGAVANRTDTDEVRAQKIADVGAALEADTAILKEGTDVDTLAYHRAVREVRDLDPTIVDLLSPPVEPGAEVTTGASLPRGVRLVGDVELTGPAAKAFAVIDAPCVDGEATTWCEVRARNTSSIAQRLTAMIHTEAVP